MLTAYIDESCRTRRAETTSVYALAASIVPDIRAGECRAVMQDLLMGKSSTVHWRTESPDRQVVLTKGVHELSLAHLVTIGLYNDRRHERARQRCLAALLWELQERAVAAAHLESRHYRRDVHDRRSISTLAKAGVIARSDAVTWGVASDEPLLWLPDIVAGAITWWLDGQSAYYATLAAQIDIVDVDLP